VHAFEARFDALLATGKRSRKLEAGSDAVSGACAKGRGFLVIVATDAAQAAELTEVRRAVREGRALAWGDKASLARAVQRAPRTNASGELVGVGVAAVTDARLARALRESLLVVESLRTDPVRPETSAQQARSSAGADAPRRGSRGGAEARAASRSTRDTSGPPTKESTGEAPRRVKRGSNVEGTPAKVRGSNGPGAESGSPDAVE
jgi:hypothetical protein